MGFGIWPWSRIAADRVRLESEKRRADRNEALLQKAHHLLEVEKGVTLINRRTIRQQDFIIQKGNFRDESGRMQPRGVVPKFLKDQARKSVEKTPVKS